MRRSQLLWHWHAMSAISFREFFATFGRIGILSFGGPAGQIALMHRVLVEEKRWLDEKSFLHALSFCMLLPGPEAMQLATYAGWLARGVRGGLIAGLLFVLPGFAVLLALSVLYATAGSVPGVAGLLFGLKAAVLAIVAQALLRVAGRALTGGASLAIALSAFAALALLRLPFPLVVAAAALAGALWPHSFRRDAGEPSIPPAVARPWRHVARVLGAGVAFWLAPLAALVWFGGAGNVLAAEALFFSRTAIVTFGGAYAVLAYVGQQAVEAYGWLSPGEMLTGLGLAETTPGPLILVLVFVGFVGAFREAGGLDPLLAGSLGALVTLWFTFVPCFLWVFLGAPFMESLRGNARLSGALAAITAAVVGVIANLSLWFSLHVLFAQVGEFRAGPVALWMPELASFDWRAAAIAGVAGLSIWKGAGMASVLGAAAVLGVLAGLA